MWVSNPLWLWRTQQTSIRIIFYRVMRPLTSVSAFPLWPRLGWDNILVYSTICLHLEHFRSYSSGTVSLKLSSVYQVSHRCTRLSGVTDHCHLSRQKRTIFFYTAEAPREQKGCLSALTCYTHRMGIVFPNILGWSWHSNGPEETAATTYCFQIILETVVFINQILFYFCFFDVENNTFELLFFYIVYFISVFISLTFCSLGNI